MVYQNFLREFWSIDVTYDLFPSTDKTEQCPLREFLIKVLVLNGQRPLTLDFKTLSSSTGLDYNNGKYEAHPTPKAIKKVLGKITINPSSLDKTLVLKNSFPVAYRILFTFVIQDEKFGFLPGILSHSNFTKDPSKVTDIELTAHMIAVNSQKDSVSPLPLAAKLKKRKSQTVTPTLPKSRGPKVLGTLSKKSKRHKSKNPPIETKARLKSRRVLKGQLGTKTQEGNIPPVDIEPIHTTVGGPSGTGAKYNVDETQSTRLRPSPAIESNLDDLQNKNPSVTETGESTSSILSKPEIKFVKAADRPTETKTDKVETAKKPAVKYAKMYRRTSKSSNVRGNQRNWNNLKSQQLVKNFVMKNKACFNCGDFDHLSYDYGKWVEKGKSRTKNNTHKIIPSRTVFHKADRSSIKTNRPNMNVAQPNRRSFYKPSHSYVSRPFQGRSAARTQPRVPTVNKRFPTVDLKFSTSARCVNTAAPRPNMNSTRPKNTQDLVVILIQRVKRLERELKARTPPTKIHKVDRGRSRRSIKFKGGLLGIKCSKSFPLLVMKIPLLVHFPTKILISGTTESDEEEVLAAREDIDEDPHVAEEEHHEEAEVSYADIKASIDQYYDENIAHRDQTDKLIEASMISLEKSSTTISDIYQGLDVITQLLRDINNASTMKDLQAHALKQEEVSGIATESDEDPLKKLVPASTIVRLDPDEEEVKVKVPSSTIVRQRNVVQEEAKKLGINPKEEISTKDGEQFKKAQDAWPSRLCAQAQSGDDTLFHKQAYMEYIQLVFCKLFEMPKERHQACPTRMHGSLLPSFQGYVLNHGWIPPPDHLFGGDTGVSPAGSIVASLENVNGFLAVYTPSDDLISTYFKQKGVVPEIVLYIFKEFDFLLGRHALDNKIPRMIVCEVSKPWGT
nr:nodulin MtN21 /EamA-like transporter family protein [Tanacetum cinerariifolium]